MVLGEEVWAKNQNFGYKKYGDSEYLNREKARYNFNLHVKEPIEINNVTVVSDDNKQAFIYGLLDYKKTSLSEIENDQKPTLCPETTDLSIEEIDDCIDITIQELLAASEKAQAFYLEEAKKEDAASAEVFRENGVEIAEMTAEDFDAWRALAKETSYKKFVEETPNGQELLDMALAVE